LDKEAYVALCVGREQLARERAEAGGIGSSEQTLIPDPALTATFTEAVTTSTAFQTTSAPTTEAAPADAAEKDPSGNIGFDPSLVDYLITSYEFDEFCDLYPLTYGLDAPLSTFSVMPTSSMPTMTSPPPAVSSSPITQVTPPGSQPGSQEEKIVALQNLDDQALTPEKRSETESDEMTPEKTTIEESPSASAVKKSAEKRHDKSVSLVKGENLSHIVLQMPLLVNQALYSLPLLPRLLQKDPRSCHSNQAAAPRVAERRSRRLEFLVFFWFYFFCFLL